MERRKTGVSIKRIPTEHQEQVALFQWASYHHHTFPGIELMYAIPNGGHRHISVARKLKAEGVKRGVPDIFLPVARGAFHGMYIEMKRRNGGMLSYEQDQYITKLLLNGYHVLRCNGAEEAMDAIRHYYTL